jgi:hypothetical protein
MITSPLKVYVLDAYGGTVAVEVVCLFGDSNPSLIFVHTVFVKAAIRSRLEKKNKFFFFCDKKNKYFQDVI